MQAIVAQALRACSRTLPAKSLASRVALSVPRRGFLIVPSYKSRVAVAFRSYATAAATKKPAAKKPAAKKTAATTRKKAVATKSNPKAKAAKKPTKPKPKKVELSPEKKAAAEKRALRQVSLSRTQPKKLPFTSWLVYCNVHATGPRVGKDLGTAMKGLAADFKKLSASERERLQEQAGQNAATNAVNLKKWVESHPVDVITRASKARSRLARVYNVRISPLKIPDERKLKRPGSAFAMYIHAHARDTPLSGTAATRVKVLAEQWRNLGAAEKKAFVDLAAAERVKFHQEQSEAKL